MVKVINARTARNNFSAMIDTAMQNNQVIVTRFNRPAVVVTSFENFNPRDTMSKKEWDKGFETIEQLRKKAKDLPQEEIYQLVEEAIQGKSE